MLMDIVMKFAESKDRRSNSCLDRAKTEKFNENRTFSLTDHCQTNPSTPLDSSTESIQRHSTPKHDLYRIQKQSYQNVKKRFTNEVDQLLKDSSIVIVSDWLKVRGTFRDWTKLWAVLKPGLIVFYRNSISMVCLELLFCLLFVIDFLSRIPVGLAHSFFHLVKVNRTKFEVSYISRSL